MTITAQMLLTELGSRAWSGFNLDDMVWGNDNAVQATAELNSAIRYLINKEDFPFRVSEQTITTVSDTASYNTPTGQIIKVYDKNTKNELAYIGDVTQYDLTTKGTPTSYYIDYSNPTASLGLYPVPDDVYSIGVVFNHYEPVIDVNNGKLKFLFENAGDYINIPFDNLGNNLNLEYLFMDCLVLQTMIQNNRDEEDENFRPTINEFNARWHQFIKLAKPVKITPKIVW